MPATLGGAVDEPASSFERPFIDENLMIPPKVRPDPILQRRK